MGAAKGSPVTISFTCRLLDGTPFDLEHGTLTLAAGTAKMLPTLQEAVVGMEPGERRVVAVPAGEVNEYLHARTNAAGARKERRAGFGYDFGPGEGGDVLLTIPQAPVKPAREVPAGVSTVLFEVTMVREEVGGKR